MPLQAFSEIKCSKDIFPYNIVHRDGRRIPVVDYGHLAQRKDSAVFYVFVHEDRR